MNSQDKSPLLRLPRELRDEIYAYCMHEEEGYHHVFDASGVGQLIHANGDVLEFPLRATCKSIACETKGVGFESNVVHLYPGDQQLVTALGSKALKFKRLLEYANVTKWRMLLRCGPECVTPEILDTVERAYPGHHFATRYMRALTEAPDPTVWRGFNSWYVKYERFSHTGHRALQYCLKLASAHPRIFPSHSRCMQFQHAARYFRTTSAVQIWQPHALAPLGSRSLSHSKLPGARKHGGLASPRSRRLAPVPEKRSVWLSAMELLCMRYSYPHHFQTPGEHTVWSEKYCSSQGLTVCQWTGNSRRGPRSSQSGES